MTYTLEQRASSVEHARHYVVWDDDGRGHCMGHVYHAWDGTMSGSYPAAEVVGLKLMDAMMGRCN